MYGDPIDSSICGTDGGDIFCETPASASSSMNCNDVVSCVSTTLNAVNPKSVASQGQWNLSNLIQKVQLIIDALSPKAAPVVSASGTSIQLPTAAVNVPFSAAATEPGATVQDANITYVSGPQGSASSNLTFTPGTTVVNGTAVLGGMTTQGTYTFRIIATDSNTKQGQTEFDVSVTAAVANVNVYWYWLDPADVNYASKLSAWKANPSAVASGTIGITHNATFPADFRGFPNPGLLLFAEPTTETAKTKWYVTDLNQGNIGGTEDFIQNDGTSGSNRFYKSAYATIQTGNIIQLKIS